MPAHCIRVSSSLLFLLLSFMCLLYNTPAWPIAPATPDGATPITAKLSAADFGAEFAELAENPAVAAANGEADDAAAALKHSQAEEKRTDAGDSAFKISLLPTPEKTAESVNLEHEGIPSKVLSSYDYSQKKVVELTDPKPILDTISEHEKYGNSGDMFDGISRSIVNGYEAFSNLLNTIIQKPKELARSITKGITAQLDIIGGKIVGL